MGLFEYTMIYIMSWWVVLLMVLPFGSHLPATPEENTYHSAPERANIGRKLLITTILAAIATIIIGWGINREYFTLWFEPF